MKLHLPALFAFGILGCTAAASAQEDPQTVVAAAVRENGFGCASPESVTADPTDTAPDEKAWIIKCETGTYRVKFRGDTGAVVEPVMQ